MQYIQPYTQTIWSANFKSTPADFIVKEQFLFQPNHQGEHYWLYIQKTQLNTAYLASLLAKWAAIDIKDVGYSGLKDRHAITEQWFSLRIPTRTLPKIELNEFLNNHLNHDEKVQVLQTAWHNKKLNRGTHQGNLFKIRLRDIQGDKSSIEQQLHSIKQQGVPNYFGEQRFGHDLNNLHNAKQFFQKILHLNKAYRPNKKTMQKDGLLISAARSVLFNQMLAKRIELNNWNQAIDGDVFNLNGSGSIFCEPPNETLHQRILVADIHPTAPLFGVGNFRHTAQAKSIYDGVLSLPENQILIDGLTFVQAKLTYRPLRLMVEKMSHQFDENDLLLEFWLPKGSFATVVLQALCCNLHQPSAVFFKK